MNRIDQAGSPAGPVGRPGRLEVVVHLPDTCLVGEAELYGLAGAVVLPEAGSDKATAASSDVVVRFGETRRRGVLEATAVRARLKGARHVVIAGLPGASDRDSEVQAETAALVRVLRRSVDLSLRFEPEWAGSVGISDGIVP